MPMGRLDELRRFADKEALGLEIAAYFNPIVPKAQGYRAMVLDVFDTQRLRDNAIDDQTIPKDRIEEIEEVDIVADASALGREIEARGLAGQFNYIVSSHNFEHLPDPIRFLQGCLVALKPAGTRSMAMPDYRACFDHFRMPTRLSDWLAAYHEARQQPSPETHFDSMSNVSVYRGSNSNSGSCMLNRDDPTQFVPQRHLRDAYAAYSADPGPYRDMHCSVMFGATFELMVKDLIHLGLLEFEVVGVTETRGHEFFAHLRKPLAPGTSVPSDADHYARREVLLRRINSQLGLSGFPNQFFGLRHAETTMKSVVRNLLGGQTIQRFSTWNKRLRGRR